MGHRHTSAFAGGHGEFLGPRRGAHRNTSLCASDQDGATELTRLGFSSRPDTIGARALLFLIAAYQASLAPFLGGACRFHPSCSNYAREAVLRHGARRGGLLALRRLLRCRPFGARGYDPVPEEHVL